MEIVYNIHSCHVIMSLLKAFIVLSNLVTLAYSHSPHWPMLGLPLKRAKLKDLPAGQPYILEPRMEASVLASSQSKPQTLEEWRQNRVRALQDSLITI